MALDSFPQDCIRHCTLVQAKITPKDWILPSISVGEGFIFGRRSACFLPTNPHAVYTLVQRCDGFRHKHGLPAIRLGLQVLFTRRAHCGSTGPQPRIDLSPLPAEPLLRIDFRFTSIFTALQIRPTVS